MSAIDQQKQSWKEKYLSSLDQQERQERQFKLLLSLLNKAAVRVSMITEGLDGQLDNQLKGMRALLGAESISGKDLKMVVEALGGQVKRVDAIKSERGKVIASAFDRLIDQLKALKPASEDRQALKSFSKNLKARSALIPEQAALIKEFAELQQQLLSRAEATPVAPSLWQTMFGSKKGEPALQAEESSEEGSDGSQNNSAELESAVLEPEPASQNLSLSMSVGDETVAGSAGVDLLEREPSFSKFNDAICGLLKELLLQIEIPPMAKGNFDNAMEQIDRGLNWYELVATLEQVSIVIISAFDRDQMAFEAFLTQLNERLDAAYEFISLSRQSQGESGEANNVLRDSMREQVAAMQHSVAEANDLEQLKVEVSQRLDKVLGAMDTHQQSDQARDNSLSHQLDSLVEQVKHMEKQSQEAEQKIEEQRQRALRDVLTQLPNREAYQLRLEQEFERWQRYTRPLSLVVCDIDHFKLINDNYGHQAGDKVLRIIARSLASRLRKTDFIARFGGEEFVVLMPETEENGAFKVIDNIREAIASCPFHFKEKPVSITLSFGVTEFRQDDQPDAVFARSDKALYEAKEGGRNKVVLAGK